ncbi:MAG: family 1 extracellular solute-binding protein [Paenibacillus sp.]|nr:family 1 extracellular solute-binding protein [Paenibacillus sp.]
MNTKMKQRWTWSTIAGSSLLIALTGCSGDKSAQQQPASTTNPAPAAAAPVTLKFGWPGTGWLTEAEFDQFVVAPVKKKHPNITIERLTISTSVQELEKLMLQGTEMDLYITSSGSLDPFKNVALTMNMELLIQTEKFNLSTIEDGFTGMMRRASGNNELHALPYSSNLSALYYNKDLFDKFGVAYPKDGMTWKETTELAKRLTRSEGGVNYLGLDPAELHRSATQLEMGFVDPTSLKAIVNNSKWANVFQMHKDIFSIPGNDFFSPSKGFNGFLKDKTLAMYAINNTLNRLNEEGKGLNWDITSYPTFPENPGKGLAYDLHVVGVTGKSKHKEAAFQVVASMLSDEVQMDLSRNGRVAVMKDKKYNEQFGANLPFLKGKNVAAIFKTTPAVRFLPTLYDAAARNIVMKIFSDQVMKGNKDINTALREADEEINTYIQANKGK